MNEYDSARMADVLRAGADLVATDDPLEADLLLMNTCSVREKAQEKVFSLLGEWRGPEAGPAPAGHGARGRGGGPGGPRPHRRGAARGPGGWSPNPPPPPPQGARRP